jgi:hypothetical protein
VRNSKQNLRQELRRLKHKTRLLEQQLSTRVTPEDNQDFQRAFQEVVIMDEPARAKMQGRLNKREAKVLYNASFVLPVIGDAFSIACRKAGRGTAFASQFYESLEELADDEMVKDSLRELYESEELELFADPKMTLGLKIMKKFIGVARGQQGPKRPVREAKVDPHQTTEFLEYQARKRAAANQVAMQLVRR